MYFDFNSLCYIPLFPCSIYLIEKSSDLQTYLNRINRNKTLTNPRKSKFGIVRTQNLVSEYVLLTLVDPVVIKTFPLLLFFKTFCKFGLHYLCQQLVLLPEISFYDTRVVQVRSHFIIYIDPKN